jgi:hypothetical protein
VKPAVVSVRVDVFETAAEGNSGEPSVNAEAAKAAIRAESDAGKKSVLILLHTAQGDRFVGLPLKAG